MIEVERLKGMLWWGLPLMFGLLALFSWSFLAGVPRMYAELQQAAPSLSISTGLVLMPLFAFMVAAWIVMMPLRIWRLEKWANWFEKRIAIPSLVLCVISIPIVLIGGRILQQTYLPQMGYSECNKLRGAPSVYFTDWVKDPAWCVYQKDHAWVREQAAKADAAKSQKRSETSAPAK
jgi:hypothetical protein